MRWEALVLFGSYYATEFMRKEWEYLKNSGSDLLDQPENRQTLAKLFIYHGNYQDSWKILQTLIGKSNVSPISWLVLLDLYGITRKSEKPENMHLHAEIVAYLNGNLDNLRKNTILLPIWPSLLYPHFSAALEEWKKTEFLSSSRELASSDDAKTPEDHLKARVQSVSQLLQGLGTLKRTLKEYVKKEVPQVTVETICAAPVVQKKAVDELRSLEFPPIVSKQWPEFVEQLKNKADELLKIAEQEDAFCRAQRNEIAFLPSIQQSYSPLCEKDFCYPERVEGFSELVAVEGRVKSNSNSNLEKVRQYLQIGGWATADMFAYSVASIEERSMLLGYIRLARGDSWNALPLFREAEKKSEYRSQSKLFLARIAWRKNDFDVAKRELAGVDEKTLSDWESDLLLEMKRNLLKG